MSGVTRHPRLPVRRPTPPRNRLADVVTVVVAVGMMVGFALLLAGYLGVIA